MIPLAFAGTCHARSSANVLELNAAMDVAFAGGDGGSSANKEVAVDDGVVDDTAPHQSAQGVELAVELAADGVEDATSIVLDAEEKSDDDDAVLFPNDKLLVESAAGTAPESPGNAATPPTVW
jgi:hypothetical protein